MSKPQSILGQVKGMARDFSLDQLPKGYVWDLVDYIPDIRGAQLEGRGPWTYLSESPFPGPIWGGYDAVFDHGEKLLVAAGPNLYEQPRRQQIGGTGAAILIDALFASIPHNGRMLHDRVYFADAQASQVPKYVTYNGTTVEVDSIDSSAPKGGLLDVYKGRLIMAKNDKIFFSPVEADGGPLGTWDSLSYLESSRTITALGTLSNQILLFQNGSTERIKGSMPTTKLSDSDFEMDTFSNQYGCVDPASVVPWQENLIFANSHGVHLTDGSSIRSLTDQGGISEAWRHLYGLKRSGTQVSCGIHLNMLFASILTSWDANTAREDRPFVFVCDLGSRTWYRLTNVYATCFIPATTGVEQVWWGVDANATQPSNFANRLARLAPIYAGLSDMDPDFNNPTSFPDAVDGNLVPVLPRVTTGFVALGPEGQKRMRMIYVSHSTQSQTPPAGDVLKVGYRLTPVVRENFVEVGTLPASLLYDRKRLPVGRPGYGIQVHVEQVLPSHISRLYDIGIEGWPIDQGQSLLSNGSYLGGLGQSAALTEVEQRTVTRLLSDSTYFPVEFKRWLKDFIESEARLNKSQIVGLDTGGGGVGDATGLPPGIVLPYASSTYGSDVLPCNGAKVSRTIYAPLFEAIGTTWGAGDGSTTFTVPDLRDRTLFGMGNVVLLAQTDLKKSGQRGGPFHYHTVPVGSGSGGAASGGPSGTIPTSGSPFNLDGPSYAGINYVITTGQ